MIKNIRKEKIKQRLKRLLEGLYKNPERGLFLSLIKFKKLWPQSAVLVILKPASKAGFLYQKKNPDLPVESVLMIFEQSDYFL